MTIKRDDKVEVKENGLKGTVTARNFNQVWVLIDGEESKYMSWELKKVN